MIYGAFWKKKSAVICLLFLVLAVLFLGAAKDSGTEGCCDDL